ncbi:hypothetical protein BCR34DRAFT_23313 [Clohesyomyces aquaticus]|uniref:TM7S3/TM198-like domain-containing protein n=1 Tax=Clohesyomyces aquaticus TaxID=1231657 RepID=A0A1Y2A587_9PLEO|nr:hypothetical protein BCR34DRAFT_23313 [Clohesyomyces aquaticus]
MRSICYLLACLALAFSLEAAALHNAAIARQDGPQSSQPSESPKPTNIQSSQSAVSFTQSSVKETVSARPSEQASKTQSNAAAGSSSAAPSTIIQAPISTAPGEPAPSQSAAADSTSPLPIQPKITPAVGLAGAILLISGVVYTVIGIKNKWLYVFFSAAYLTSLAVTVLIVYLMSPPVSDAVQAAFFVAAFFSGLIFGALALVFSDITDGLGCMLGGFCLSMWFLTLKEGGLIASATGRAIFIGTMTFAGFSLSFSHYTRTYGLICSISFAGATITVLGIDCLSRAGWKEFWLYLWGLNSNTFPLNTNTYPITRALRVEIAIVILLCAFGLVSQLRLWKLVKERREKSAAQRIEHDQNAQREEEELGRKIEDNFTRERAQWEATYADKGIPDSSYIGSSNGSYPKTSTSIQEKRGSGTDSMEMVDFAAQQNSGIKADVSRAPSKHAGTGPSVTVTVLRDDEIQQIDEDGNPIAPKKRQSKRHSGSTRTSTEIKSAESNGLPRSASTRSSLRASVVPPPVVVPLPFTIPKEEDGENQDDDNSSVSAVLESISESVRDGKPSKRLSVAPIRKRLSVGRQVSDGSVSQEALIESRIEDDRASSVAATMDNEDEDDHASMSQYSASQSALGLKTVEESEAPETSNPDASKNVQTPSEEKTIKRREQDDTGEVPATTGPANIQLLTASTDPNPTSTPQKPASPTSRRHSGSKEQGSVAPSGSSQTGSHVASLKKGSLPEKMSKVALSYRTNEWAKHLELAEKPELDDIPEPESPGVGVDHGFQESAAPVNAELIQPAPMALVNPKRNSSGNNPYRNSNLVRSASNLSRYSQMEPPQALSRTPSAVTLASPTVPHSAFPAGGIPRSGSATKLRSNRNPPTTLLSQTLVESPVEDSLAMSHNATPSPPTHNTLMSQRDALVRNRVTSQPLSGYASTPNLPLRGQDTSSTRALRSENIEQPSIADRMRAMNQENMTLAQQKQLIQSQKQPSASLQRQTSWGIGANAQGFDSHQPKRDSTTDQGRRESMLASWRESMRHETVPAQTIAISEESRRAAMISDARQKEMEKQQQAMASTYRDTMMGNMMRSGQMQEAHREAMRRLQANASKNA